jgi:hypothetical protein
MNSLQGRGRFNYMRYANCHPERKHKAFGLCTACYQRTPKMRAYQNAYNRTPESKEWYRNWEKSEAGKISVRKYRSSEKGKKTIRASHRARDLKNPLHKLKRLLRDRIKKAIKRTYLEGSGIKNLGCTVADLKMYLESLFQPGMTWDNYGLRGWHIDHIVPLASAKTSDELAKLCHYSNLQPLWWIDNLKKGAKLG